MPWPDTVRFFVCLCVAHAGCLIDCKFYAIFECGKQIGAASLSKQYDEDSNQVLLTRVLSSAEIVALTNKCYV